MSPRRLRRALALSFCLASVSFVVSGCTDPLSDHRNPSSSTDDRHADWEREHELVFHIEPPLPQAVGTSDRYRISAPRSDDTFEALAIEPRSGAVDVVSKDLQPADNPSFVLHVSSAGTHHVHVRAEVEGGRERRRTFAIEARPIAEVELEPEGHVPQELPPDTVPPYLVDSTARISLDLRDSDGNLLGGHGRCPLEWKPKNALEIDREASGVIDAVFQTGSEPGTVVLQSEVDDERREIRLIDASMVDDLELAERVKGYIDPDFPLPVRGLWAAHVLPVYDDITIFDASLDASLTSETPEVCEVVSDSKSTFEEHSDREVDSILPPANSEDAFVVNIRRAGECELNAELPEANHGEGATLHARFPIAE